MPRRGDGRKLLREPPLLRGKLDAAAGSSVGTCAAAAGGRRRGVGGRPAAGTGAARRRRGLDRPRRRGAGQGYARGPDARRCAAAAADVPEPPTPAAVTAAAPPEAPPTPEPDDEPSYEEFVVVDERTDSGTEEGSGASYEEFEEIEEVVAAPEPRAPLTPEAATPEPAAEAPAAPAEPTPEPQADPTPLALAPPPEPAPARAAPPARRKTAQELLAALAASLGSGRRRRGGGARAAEGRSWTRARRADAARPRAPRGGAAVSSSASTRPLRVKSPLQLADAVPIGARLAAAPPSGVRARAALLWMSAHGPCAPSVARVARPGGVLRERPRRAAELAPSPARRAHGGARDARTAARGRSRFSACANLRGRTRRAPRQRRAFKRIVCRPTPSC